MYIYTYIYTFFLSSRGLLELGCVRLGVKLAKQYIAQYCKQHAIHCCIPWSIVSYTLCYWHLYLHVCLLHDLEFPISIA